MSLLDIVANDTKLKQVSATGTGEWAGPCPFCRKNGVPNGGNDRFHVILSPDGSDDKWFCRQCSPKNERKEPRWQEPYQYLMKRDNISVFDARTKYEYLGGRHTWRRAPGKHYRTAPM